MYDNQDPERPNTHRSSGTSFWERLTKGDLGLAKTFWLVWFLPNWILGTVSQAAVSMAAYRGSGTLGFALLMLGVYIAYFILTSVWTWRAANKSPSGWAIAAKIWIGFNVVLAALGLIYGLAA